MAKPIIKSNKPTNWGEIWQPISQRVLLYLKTFYKSMRKITQKSGQRLSTVPRKGHKNFSKAYIKKLNLIHNERNIN